MTDTRLRGFRAALAGHQTELLKSGRSREAIAIDTSADELDRIQLAREREQSIDGLERESRRLREIRHALDRMASGQYGVCAVCEAEISLARLTAVPWTPLCLECQEAEERESAAPDYAEAVALSA